MVFTGTHAGERRLSAGLKVNAVQQNGGHRAQGQSHALGIKLVVLRLFCDVEAVVAATDLVDELRRVAVAYGGVEVLVEDVSIGTVAGIEILVRQGGIVQLLQLLADISN